MGDPSPAESSTGVLAGTVRLKYIDSIGQQDRPRSPRPAKYTLEEISPAVANRTPSHLRFPDVEGHNSGTVPKLEHWDKIGRVHCTNAQDMEMEMGRGLRMPPPIQRRWKYGGHFSSRKEVEQILLFGDTTSHARQQHLLGGTYACRTGPGRMAFDV